MSAAGGDPLEPARNKRGTPLYSKEDMREQYCITSKQLDVLDRSRGAGRLFGCLSKYQESSCSSRHSLLSSCVRDDGSASDGGLPHEAPMQARWRYQARLADSEELEAYLRKRHRALTVAAAAANDPSRFSWLPEDDEPDKMERRALRSSGGSQGPSSYRSSRFMSYSNEYLPGPPSPPPPPPPPPPTTQSGPTKTHKHVSFARSYTLASLDEAVTVSSGQQQYHQHQRQQKQHPLTHSQERLIDGRKVQPDPIEGCPLAEAHILLLKEKAKRSAMKTQATQTELKLRRGMIERHLALSPYVLHKVRMVSQGAQTNGFNNNNNERRLTKSYSEAGVQNDLYGECFRHSQHEFLFRTQSEEPPRSPFLMSESPNGIPIGTIPNASAPSSPTAGSNGSGYREIFINYKPHESSGEITDLSGDASSADQHRLGKKKLLHKTLSESEILLERRRVNTLCNIMDVDLLAEAVPRSADTDTGGEYSSAPFLEPLEKRSMSLLVSMPAGSEGSFLMDEDEFHENLIYREIFRKRLLSTEDGLSSSAGSEPEVSTMQSQTTSTVKTTIVQAEVNALPEKVVPTIIGSPGERIYGEISVIPPLNQHSPFESSDSLATDIRDHSDGIWNESQATVLQAECCSHPGGLMALTPSSRRKQLLMLQHQQRSSMDTEALDDDLDDQVAPSSPRVWVSSSSSTGKLHPPGPDTTISLQEDLTVKRRSSASSERIREGISSFTGRGEQLWWLRNRLSPEIVEVHASESAGDGGVIIIPESQRVMMAAADLSETSTTDDYFTANSDTSSRGGAGGRTGTTSASGVGDGGSSFESASSVYSIARTELVSDELVQFSGSPVMARTPSAVHRPSLPASKTSQESEATGSGATSASGDHHAGYHADTSISEDNSSSSGSYSVESCWQSEGPIPDDLDPEISESIEQETSRFSLEEKREWTEEEKQRMKKCFKLNFTPVAEVEVSFRSPHGASPDVNAKMEPSQDPKEQESFARKESVTPSICSPLQMTRKPPPPSSGVVKPSVVTITRGERAQAVVTPCMVRSPAVHDGLHAASNEWSKTPTATVAVSAPQKAPPLRRQRSGSGGTLLVQATIGSATATSARLSPHRYSRSPGSSPNRRARFRNKPPPLQPQQSSATIAVPTIQEADISLEESRLKAVSAESLRSVSPGSDSVFYSDPSSSAAPQAPPPIEQQVVCYHCGREVDQPTSKETPEIVKPPACFADSPDGPRALTTTTTTTIATPKPGQRLYKKFDKRFRSEERGRHNRFRCEGARAKSEERSRNEAAASRPLVRSTDTTSLEALLSEPSPTAMGTGNFGELAKEDDEGVYADSYLRSTWIFIGDTEEMLVWQKTEKKELGKVHPECELLRKRSQSLESTASEREFRRKYQAVTHRMVHRKSSLEMYKRLANNTFQCDKTLVVRREAGEFGFRIHGSRPIVVSAIEPETPAECSGLEVGDIIITVNGVNVLDSPHSEVVKIAHDGPDELELEVARTCTALVPLASPLRFDAPLYTGYLWRKGTGMTPRSSQWNQRWFCLKRDRCLYFYKHDKEQQPLGAFMLVECQVSTVMDDRPNAFVVERSGKIELRLAADNPDAASRWVAVIQRTIELTTQEGPSVDTSARALCVPPAALLNPDCTGYLMKLSRKWKVWQRRYLVLKHAKIYWFIDAEATSAIGITYLHGYRVQNLNSSGKRFAFELVPPEQTLRHFYLHADSDMDKKRWVAALEYSIDRWIKAG